MDKTLEKMQETEIKINELKEEETNESYIGTSHEINEIKITYIVYLCCEASGIIN